MIAYSDQANANQGGESGGNFFTECCNIVNGEEDCTSTFGKVEFPKQNCGFLGMAMSMPTCWDLRDDSPDHKEHMAYTLNGEVAGKYILFFFIFTFVLISDVSSFKKVRVQLVIRNAYHRYNSL